MNFARFLRSQLLLICIVLLATSAWCVYAVLASVNGVVVALTALCIVLCVIIYIICQYIFADKRLKKLNRILAELDEKYLLGEVLPLPENALEEEYFMIMKAVSRSAIETAELAKKSRDEYCEYVEKWVHEIKTPLTACSLILANDGDKRKLREQLRRADNVTENILYFARLKNSGASTQIVRTDVRSAVDDAVKSEMELLLSAGIGVEADGDFETCTDRKALVFILKQLLVNCAKYCRGAHIKITAEEGMLTFEDNGPGIPAHELSRIFSRGFSGSAAAGSDGTGMGLYLVKKTCENLGIEVTAASDEGKFTRFTFAFPSVRQTNLTNL